MAAASPPDGGSLSPETIEDLRDELQVQEIILSSLDDAPDPDEDRRVEIERNISELKNRIDQARGQTQGSYYLEPYDI